MTIRIRPRRCHVALRPGGFTLVEAVMVIVITGILAAMVAVFIVSPTKGYIDTVRRAEITDAADTALRQFAREVHLALPNSLRISDSSGTVDGCSNAAAITCYIEFIITKGGGRYRDTDDGSTGGNFLSFTNPASTTFDVLGAPPANSDIAVNDFIVVYNLGPGYDPANAYKRGQNHCDATPTSPGCNIALVTAKGGNLITLDANPFANQSPPLRSPSSRFQVVPGGVKAVTYACPSEGSSPGEFRRYWDYGFNAGAPNGPPPGATSAVATSNVTCVVSYSPNVSSRNALLYIKLNVTDASGSGEKVEVFQQIYVDNSP